MIEAILERFSVSPETAAAARAAARKLPPHDEMRGARTAARMLAAFADEGLAQHDLVSTLGYGYDDAARDRYESLLARLLGAERALARLAIVSGTHAIVAALAACAPPGTRLLSATGRPYDTLRAAIADAPHALVARGVRYAELPLAPSGAPDLAALAVACARGIEVVFVQRSRGYAPRPSLSAAACGEIAAVVHAAAPQALVLVDNCYGELVDETEPTAHGCDLVMGSLIKNLGGSLAPGGGYIAGRADLVERVAAHLFAPGLGTAVGSSLGFGRAFVQGLFFAPTAVRESLRGLDFAAGLFAELGYAVDPAPGAVRHDIIQAIRLGSEAALVAFARGLQRAMPLDARFLPEPGRVPGYADPVIMSGGAFVSGATIELSCDAPLREPYEAYLQGGTLSEHVVLGAIYAADGVAALLKK